jgi:hypothetical protein
MKSINKTIYTINALTQTMKCYPYCWYNIKSQISAFFNPRQRWLTKKIPKTWHDKDGLIQIVLFECVVNYVEDENGLKDKIDWSEDMKNGHISQDYIDHVKDIDGRIRKVYEYITKTRPKLHAQLDAAYPEYVGLGLDITGTYEELYGEVNRIEKEISEKDTWAMQTIVELRECMWT